ncbi:MAG: hypothetical protein JWP97_3596 [Labilithrix sp.]|nr:hypothetical protein [Labilithrix sp.]
MHDTSPRFPGAQAARSAARSDLLRAAAVALALAGLAGLAGCTPEIGDKCVLSTDCSSRGDRLCDTSQPDGYCTQFNCTKNSCPDEATCVLFDQALPGCAYDDRSGEYGSRVARAFCVASCTKNSDCRPGYQCTDPKVAPYSGLVLDDDRTKRTCLVIPASFDPDAGTDAGGTAVCSAVGPAVDPIDASPPSIGGDASTPGPRDAGPTDGGTDGGDAGDGG